MRRCFFDLDDAPSFTKKEGALFYDSKTVEWWTPRKYIKLAFAVMGGIDLDPASCADANKIVRAREFYDAHGENKSWHGRIWLNPPYGKQARLFIDRLMFEWRIEHVQQAVVLLNVTMLDRGWFRPLYQFPMCFHHGRVKFTSPDVESGKIKQISTPPTGSVFVYLGPNVEKFAQEFHTVGDVLCRF